MELSIPLASIQELRSKSESDRSSRSSCKGLHIPGAGSDGVRGQVEEKCGSKVTGEQSVRPGEHTVKTRMLRETGACSM